jgi:hypothetical protein
MTSNLVQRILQHKTHECEGFTDSYNAVRLVYWESFDAVALYLGQKRSLFALQAFSQLHESFSNFSFALRKVGQHVAIAYSNPELLSRRRIAGRKLRESEMPFRKNACVKHPLAFPKFIWYKQFTESSVRG